MLDNKTELEQYFKDEIHRVSDIEIKQIESEITDIREKALESLESDAQREAGIARDQELKELQSDHAIRLSKLREETNRKLMAKRKELCELVFTQAKEKVKAFTTSNEYREMLMKKASALAKATYEQVTFYVGSADEKYLSDIKTAYGKPCETAVDADILVGGMRMECIADGIVVDETFDTAIDDEKDWFYTNSGLFIK